MPLVSARHALPLLQSGQAQKELYHNEALALLDLALHPVVLDTGVEEVPSAPSPGQSWLVGAAPAGAWTGFAHHLAGWTEGGWRFIAPKPGMLLWSLAQGRWAYWSGAMWQIGDLPASRLLVDGVQVVGSRQPAIAGPDGGSVVDAEARQTLSQVLSALAAHGLIQP